MKKKYKQRLAKLAISLLENSHGAKVKVGDRTLSFHMGEYMTQTVDDRVRGGRNIYRPQEHACGTTCCFAGYAPSIFPYTRRLSSWDEVNYYLVGRDDCTSEFLFSTFWPDKPQQAAARTLYLLQTGEVPCHPGQGHATGFYPSYSKKRLIKELSTFL